MTLNLSMLDDVGTRVELAADMIQNNQRIIAGLTTAMYANDHTEDSPIEDWPDKSVQMTYGRRLEQLHSGIRRVHEASADIAEELAAEAFRRRTKAKRERALQIAAEDAALDTQEHEREMVAKAKPDIASVTALGHPDAE